MLELCSRFLRLGFPDGHEIVRVMAHDVPCGCDGVSAVPGSKVALCTYECGLSVCAFYALTL